MTKPDPFPAFLMGISNCRPNSRGQIRIKNNNYMTAPIIEPNYLSDEEDVKELLDGVKLIRNIADTLSLKKMINNEIRPGPLCSTDEQLIEDIRSYAWTVFHPTSTCRMGPEPLTDVVDSELKVYGVKGLRVADASIFPNLICGNINAATIMVGEKAADLILNK